MTTGRINQVTVVRPRSLKASVNGVTHLPKPQTRRARVRKHEKLACEGVFHRMLTTLHDVRWDEAQGSYDAPTNHVSDQSMQASLTVSHLSIKGLSLLACRNHSKVIAIKLTPKHTTKCLRHSFDMALSGWTAVMRASIEWRVNQDSSQNNESSPIGSNHINTQSAAIQILPPTNHNA